MCAIDVVRPANLATSLPTTVVATVGRSAMRTIVALRTKSPATRNPSIRGSNPTPSSVSEAKSFTRSENAANTMLQLQTD